MPCVDFLNWKRNLGSRWGVKNYDNDYCCFKTKSTLYFHKFSDGIWNHKEERISSFCCFFLLLVLVKPRYNRKSPLSGAIHHFSGFMHEVYTCIWTEAKRLIFKYFPLLFTGVFTSLLCFLCEALSVTSDRVGY